LPGGELYFIANTSNHAQETTASFQSSYHTAEVWDAMTGEVDSLGSTSSIKMHFEPYESRLVYLSNDPEPVRRATVTASKGSGRALEIGLGGNWTVDFTDLNRSVSFSGLQSWSDDTDFEYYSGRAEYSKTIPLSASDLKSGSPLFLDFGQATPVDVPSPLGEHSMRAYLESPVREAAEVFVNGQRAGVVWHPPYRVRIDQFLKPGANEFKIVVGDTAINSLAGQTLPDYRLLKDLHGDLFSPQDMNDLQPLPSGILGSLRITTGASN
jgi:hypothetical protein